MTVVVLDAFQQIIDVHWGGVAYLLLNVEITGGNNTTSPPPYGSFNFNLPKGSKLIASQVVSQSQKQGSGSDTFFFPWNTLVDPPTKDNWTISPPWAPSPAFQWSLIDIARGYNDPAFPTRDKDLFWYSTEAKAAVAAGVIPTISDNFYMASFGDFLSHTFSGSEFGPPFLKYAVQSITLTTSKSSTAINVKYLFQVPVAMTTVNFTFNVPGDSGGDGWASIFTKQGNVKGFGDLKGLADQSVYFPIQPVGSQTVPIVTTGRSGLGTVTIPGAKSFKPGLSPTAPPQQSSG